MSTDPLVVVTGAGGYLGGRVTTALGERARALVRTRVSWLPQATQTVCDLLGPVPQTAESLEGADVVIHLAGHNEVVTNKDPEGAAAETVAMMRNLVSAADRAGVGRILYVSTIHVYGDNLEPGRHIPETLPASPTSAYSRARHDCEQVLLQAAHDSVVLRLSNAVGAPVDPSVDRWTLVASDLCRSAVLDRTMVLRSSGSQSRDFITLHDASRIVVAAADRTRVAHGIYNLASGRSETIRFLAERIQARVEHTCGWRPELRAPDMVGEPEHGYTLSTERLAEAGLCAEQEIDAGIDELIEHCRKYESVLRER